MWFDEAAVRVRAGRKPDRGNPDATVLDWSPGAVNRLSVGGLNIQPSIQQEAADETRTAIVTGWHAQSEPGTAPDITALDRIEWDGLILEVVGEVARWPDPIEGGTHHIEFDLMRTTG